MGSWEHQQWIWCYDKVRYTRLYECLDCTGKEISYIFYFFVFPVSIVSTLRDYWSDFISFHLMILLILFSHPLFQILSPPTLFPLSHREGRLCIVRKEHIRAFAEPEDSIPTSSAQALLELISQATVWDDESISGERWRDVCHSGGAARTASSFVIHLTLFLISVRGRFSSFG